MGQEMQDLTEYGDGELSMMVFNDEGLYNMRHDGDLVSVLDDLFYDTDEQMEELERDLVEDQEDA